MVLRIKEREEAIQLLAMDPQVCGNYSRFIERAMVLMQKPSVIESPSGRTPEKAPRWDLTGTEGCGGRKVFSWFPWLFLGHMGIYRWKKQVGGVMRGPQGWGRALRPCACLVTSLTCTLGPMDVFWSKKNHRESFILFGLHLVFLFCKTLKQVKTETGIGPSVNRLVPKII